MRIWLALMLVAMVAMAPLAAALGSRRGARGRRDAAVALHRAQLAELDRDLAEGRIAAPEHATARVEVQRRLIAAADAADETTDTHTPAILYASFLLLPAAGLALYLITGSPGMPAAPLAPRLAAARKEGVEAQQLIDQLKQRLDRLDPHSPEGRQGYVLLGNVEAERANWAGAATAWQTALVSGFDPTIAVEAAEAMTRAAGHVTPPAAALYRKALDAAPKNAPWREAAEARLASLGEAK